MFDTIAVTPFPKGTDLWPNDYIWLNQSVDTKVMALQPRFLFIQERQRNSGIEIGVLAGM